jgi:hypothetical protein
MGDPTALVMDNVIVAADRRPNEAFARKRWIDNGIGRVPLSARSCEFAFVAGTKRDYRY